MNYNAVAKSILENIGNSENIESAAHCATRLRIVLRNESLINKDAIQNIDGVKGVFITAGQLQIIFGTGIVNKVFEEFAKIANIKEATKEEVKQVSAKKGSPLKRAIRTLGDIFVPILPAIVSCGLMMGIVEALKFLASSGYVDINTSGSLFVMLDLFSSAAYNFLPILIGYSAAKVFGGNVYLGAVIAMIMIHPSLQNAWTVASEGVQSTQSVWFGLYSIDMIGYQGHVIPIMIAVYVMSAIEKKLHKIVPEMLDLFVTPLVTVFVTGYLTLTIIGPIFVVLENGVLDAVQWLIQIPYGIGGFIMGGVYSTTVVAGLHHIYNIIDFGQLAQFGFSYFVPIACAANISQGGAALGVALRTKNPKTKALALPAALSALLGITEPAIFGVNLRYMRPFVAAAIGSACASLYAAVVGLGATGTGVTGIFGILLTLHAPLHYAILFAIAFCVSLVLTMIFGIKEEE
ncbi:PTS transporter subunit EIIC [Romboutsia sp. 1001713B170207_170306_H8]|uniref:PTS transporter subunit EIIC n=1 Tax=Romboutsia sp. 1001713B170207_170306_H8 TaxID=2787112 RepID=UPI000822266A|nr:PTS transporter subunit EIIC [Romboutsia sp. 1001713B170207_170306_H8]SCH04324.1 PTS system sac EIIBC component [uncultured Clostridium sp.]